jgi:hypothetical protein
MTQQITAQLLKGGLTVDASGNITATKLVGNLQGNVTGDLTGDLLGDVTGNVTGELKTGTIKASDDTLAITITDSTGKVTLAGDLTVNGTTTTINSTTLTIDDKNIVLAHSPSGSEGDDTAVDGGGITLASSDSDKTITWVNADDAWTFNQHLFPDLDNSKDLGSATKRWQNIYTTDLHLANERGNWTVIEEENYLTLRNNKTDKVYKLVMEEIE